MKLLIIEKAKRCAFSFLGNNDVIWGGRSLVSESINFLSIRINKFFSFWMHFRMLLPVIKSSWGVDPLRGRSHLWARCKHQWLVYECDMAFYERCVIEYQRIFFLLYFYFLTRHCWSRWRNAGDKKPVVIVAGLCNGRTLPPLTHRFLLLWLKKITPKTLLDLFFMKIGIYGITILLKQRLLCHTNLNQMILHIFFQLGLHQGKHPLTKLVRTQHSSV